MQKETRLYTGFVIYILKQTEKDIKRKNKISTIKILHMYIENKD